jgi:hypothetical protein
MFSFNILCEKKTQDFNIEKKQKLDLKIKELKEKINKLNLIIKELKYDNQKFTDLIESIIMEMESLEKERDHLNTELHHENETYKEISFDYENKVNTIAKMLKIIISQKNLIEDQNKKIAELQGIINNKGTFANLQLNSTKEDQKPTVINQEENEPIIINKEENKPIIVNQESKKESS